MSVFDAYEANLIMLAASADDLLAGPASARRPWADSFTREMLNALTIDDDDLIGNAFDGALPGDDVDGIDADTIRAGIVECITDQIVCEIPDGWSVITDAAGMLSIARTK